MTTVADHNARMAGGYEQDLDQPWEDGYTAASSPSTPSRSKSLRKMFSSKRIGIGKSNKGFTDHRADSASHRGLNSPGGREQPASMSMDVEEREISKFNDKGNEFFGRGEYDAALRMYSEALKMLKNPTIRMDPSEGGDEYMTMAMRRFRTARCLVNVGAVHTRRENYVDAMSALELSIRQSELVPSNSSHYYRACEVIADAMENIGLVLFKQEKYDKSSVMYTDALEARRKCLSLMESKHARWRHKSREEMRKYREERNDCLLETSVTLFYMSLLREKQSNVTEAVQKCEESIRIRRDIIPDSNLDPYSLNLFTTIGMLYCHDDVKRYREALDYFHEVHRMKCETSGRDHLDVVPSLNSIAFIYNELGGFMKCIVISERVIDIASHGRGLNKELCVAYVNKGTAHMKRHDYDKAILSFKTAIKTQEKVLEKNDMMNADSYEKLAEAYLLSNDVQKAVIKLERSIDVKKLTYGPDNEKLAEAYSKLGDYYSRGLGYSNGIKYHTRALRIFKHHDNKKMAATEHNKIATILKISGEKNKAMEHYMAALWHSREARLPSTDPIVSDTIKNVAAFQKG